MEVWVAYVTQEGLGSCILGVRPSIALAKALAQTHWDDRNAGEARSLEWSPFEHIDAKGEQAVEETADCVYYVEEAELEVATRSTDEPKERFTWEQRQILRLTIENGRLAEQVLQQASLYKPLEERVALLSSYLDHMIRTFIPGAQDKGYEMPGGERWKVGGKNEPRG